MKKTIIAAAFIAITATGFAAPTMAAPIMQTTTQPTAITKDVENISYRVLSPQRIARKLHRQGFRNVQVLGLRHGTYKVRAIGRRGPVKLTVNARNGRVVARQLIRQAPRHYRGYPRHQFGHSNGFSWSFSFGG